MYPFPYSVTLTSQAVFSLSTNFLRKGLLLPSVGRNINLSPLNAQALRLLTGEDRLAPAGLDLKSLHSLGVPERVELWLWDLVSSSAKGKGYSAPWGPQGVPWTHRWKLHVWGSWEPKATVGMPGSLGHGNILAPRLPPAGGGAAGRSPLIPAPGCRLGWLRRQRASSHVFLLK